MRGGSSQQEATHSKQGCFACLRPVHDGKPDPPAIASPRRVALREAVCRQRRQPVRKTLGRARVRSQRCGEQRIELAAIGAWNIVRWLAFGSDGLGWRCSRRCCRSVLDGCARDASRTLRRWSIPRGPTCGNWFRNRRLNGHRRAWSWKSRQRDGLRGRAPRGKRVYDSNRSGFNLRRQGGGQGDDCGARGTVRRR
jgi:hypothetical protein